VFMLLLVGVLLAAGIHAASLKQRSTPKTAELFLLYVLVGYCGVPMLIFSVWTLFDPDKVAMHFDFPPGNPFQAFAGVAFLAMSLISLLALRYRRTFLIAPAVCWIVFFAGATWIHLKDYQLKGALTHGGALHVFATHGLISVLLAGALVMSGVLKERV
jgi:hypothetical protein